LLHLAIGKDHNWEITMSASM